MTRAKRQLEIRLRATSPDLAPTRRLPRAPHNALTALICRCNLHRAACKPIAKQVAHIVPDLCAIKVVREDRLTNIRLKDTALRTRNLERDPARRWVVMERFAVRRVLCDCLLRADAAADGPEVDRLIALIGYDCTA